MIMKLYYPCTPICYSVQKNRMFCTSHQEGTWYLFIYVIFMRLIFFMHLAYASIQSDLHQCQGINRFPNQELKTK